jgi:hypothetical protein
MFSMRLSDFFLQMPEEKAVTFSIPDSPSKPRGQLPQIRDKFERNKRSVQIVEPSSSSATAYPNIDDADDAEALMFTAVQDQVC